MYIKELKQAFNKASNNLLVLKQKRIDRLCREFDMTFFRAVSK